MYAGHRPVISHTAQVKRSARKRPADGAAARAMRDDVDLLKSHVAEVRLLDGPCSACARESTTPAFLRRRGDLTAPAPPEPTIEK